MSEGLFAKYYARVLPHATYSPWNVDKEFIGIYKLVKDATMVDIYRMYELYTLVFQLNKLPEGSIIEVGVWRGGTAALLAEAAKISGVKSTIFACDTFTGVVKAGGKDSKYTGGEHADTSRELVDELLFEKLQVKNVRVLEGVFPEETSELIKDELFRLCHIDVDVYQSAKDINEWVWDRLVIGGMVVYDDFGFQTCDGITKYVNEQYDMPDRIVMSNLNGHAIIIKLK